MRAKCLFAVLVLSVCRLAHGQYVAVSGNCELPGQAAVVSGLSQSGTQPLSGQPFTTGSGVMASYPQCLVTVYPAGSSSPLPTGNVYSNITGTVLGNPFTANTDGSWTFYVTAACYDVVLSSGTSPPSQLPISKTLSGKCAGGGSGAGSYNLQVNGVDLIPGDTVNFNNTVPTAPTNGLNILFGTSKSGATDSVSAWILGDGSATHCFLGTGVFANCPGSGGSVPTGPPSSPLVSQGTGVTPVYIQGIQYATTAQTWSQSLSTSLTAGTPASVTLTPCPVGADYTSGFGYQVLITDANPEVVNVTGGSTGSGNCSLNLAATFFSHTSYTIGTASSGIQETLNNACGVDPTYYKNNQCNVTIPASGPGYPTASITTYSVQGTIYLHTNQMILSGYGVSLSCTGRGACIQVGDLVNANHFTSNTLAGLSFRSPTNFSANASYAGVPVSQTQRATNVVTITTSSAHGFRVGDMVTILFTDSSAYWGDAVITVVPSTTTFQYAKTGTDISLQATPGLVALAYVPILDNANNTHFVDVNYDNLGEGGSFNNFFDFWDDENATITHFNNQAIHLNRNFNWTGSFVFSATGAPVITLRDSTITANGSNCATVYNSNGLYVDNTVCQAQGLWEVYASNTKGNFQGASIKDIYPEASLALNPPCTGGSCPTGALTPFPGLGVAGLVAGSSTGAANFVIEGATTTIGAFPATGGSGATPLSYFIVANDTTAGTQTSPLQVLNWESTGSDSIPVPWPRVANGTDVITYDVIRMTTPTEAAATGASIYPYTGGCGGGTGGTCGYVAQGLSQSTACAGGLLCTYTDSGSGSTSPYGSSPTLHPLVGNYVGNLNYWPGSIVSVNRSIQVDVEANIIQGVGLNGNPLQIAKQCTAFGATSSGGYSACPASIAAAGVTNATAQLIVDNNPNGNSSYPAKGRQIFELSPGINIDPHHLITLIDSQPHLTFATTGFRPPASVNDTWIGTDVSPGASLSAGKLAFGAPIAISNYIANTGSSGTGWLEQLTSSLKTFAVAVQVPSIVDTGITITPSTSPICPNGTGGIFTTVGCVVGGAVSSVFGRSGAVVAVNGDYTPTQVGLGNVTNDAQTKAAIVPNTAPASGQILVGTSGGIYAPVTVSGDSTLSNTGAMANLAINGVVITGAPASGNVLTATSPTAGTWQAPTTGFINPMTLLGDEIGGSTGGTAIRIPGPTSPNGIAQLYRSTPASGIATQQGWGLPGVLGRLVTLTTATDTILTTDCSPTRVSYVGSVAVAVTLPTATTLAVPNCVFRVANKESATNDVTITPTTWTINGASSLALHLGQVATIYVDPAGTNWIADVAEPGIVAGSNVTLTRAANGLTVAATGGGGGTALSGVTAATTSNTIANGNNPQVWNWAQTTNSQTAFTFGETSAATGTSDNSVAINTLSGSLGTPLSITQAGITGTPNVPAIAITSTINNAGNSTALINVALTNTSSSSPALLNFTSGTSGTTQELLSDALGNIQIAGTVSTTTAGGFLEFCGGNAVVCVTSSATQLGSTMMTGESNGSSSSGAKAGASILSGGFLTNATPNAAALPGVVQVQAAYVKGSAIAAVGDVMCGTTTAFQVTDCPLGAVNVIGIANTTANPVGVISDGQAVVKFDGTVTLGDMACAPPAGTGTAGQAHDNGTTACPPGSSLGTIVADSGVITVIAATAKTTVTMSTTLALVQLHITPVSSGLSIPTGTATFSVGTGVTSVGCASGFSCNNSRGTLTIVGGTATTGTIATVTFSAALSAAPWCEASMNGGTTLFSIGNSSPSTTAFNITAGISVIGATFNVNYQCRT